ncbi:MAG: DUF3276 family protein [Chitinophagales bacterium]
MEFGKFRRGDRDDLNNDRGENNDRGGDRPRYSDRGGDRSRYSDRPRYGDRNDRSGGGRRFGSDRGGDRPRYGERGGFDRDRNDRGGDTEESVFSKKVRAGKRRTYFLDVRKTRGEDFFITITESTRREDGFGYKRHKIFLYKEDFNRFVSSLNEVVDHVKTELMPDFDYEEFDRRQAEWEAQNRLEEDDYEDGESVDMEGSGDDSFDEELDDRPANKSKGDDEDVSW